MSKSKKKVPILNPVPGCMRFITPSKAEVLRQAGKGQMRGAYFEFFPECRQIRIDQLGDEYQRQLQGERNIGFARCSIVVGQTNRKKMDSPGFPTRQWIR